MVTVPIVPLQQKDRVRKILNYPPGQGYAPTGTSTQQSLQQASNVGAQAVQQIKESPKAK